MDEKNANSNYKIMKRMVMKHDILKKLFVLAKL